MQYLHQKGNTSWFLDASCNTCIKVEKYNLDWWVGRTISTSKRKYGLVFGWSMPYSHQKEKNCLVCERLVQYCIWQEKYVKKKINEGKEEET
jgi:hypothetical protein